MNTFAYKTLGCKVNQYEGDAARDVLVHAGLLEVTTRADLVILNTCAVTERAVQKARQALRRLRRDHPGAVTLVTGCMSSEEIARIRAIAPEAHLVFNREREAIGPLLTRLVDGRRGPGPERAARRRTRAFLKVQDGCRLRCSFCIIPQMRGPSRSRPLSEVVSEYRSLSRRGHLEVVLCGIHLGHWGHDLPDHRPRQRGPGGPPSHPEVADLVAGLLETGQATRIRLSSLEINEVSDRLLEMIATEPAVAPHLHIPLQSGSPVVLRAMRRPYSAATFEQRVLMIRRRVPGVALTTDVIIGFPGETDADFAATLAMARKAGFSKIHAFPFSPRRGTPAADLPGRVPPAIVQQRMDACRRLEEELRREFNRPFLGARARIVPERRLPDGRLTGLTARYQRVLVTEPGHSGLGPTERRDLPTSMLEVMLERDDGRHLEATRITTDAATTRTGPQAPARHRG